MPQKQEKRKKPGQTRKQLLRRHMPGHREETRQGSIYRKRKKQLRNKSEGKGVLDLTCGKGQIFNKATGKCMKKPNIKKIPGVGKRNIAAREPLLDLNNVSIRKKAKAKAKKRYQ